MEVFFSYIDCSSMIALDKQKQEHSDVSNVWRARLEEVDEHSRSLHVVKA